jgi:hypothetical protein
MPLRVKSDVLKLDEVLLLLHYYDGNNEPEVFFEENLVDFWALEEDDPMNLLFGKVKSLFIDHLAQEFMYENYMLLTE